jgi:hypothetical protein
MVIKENLKKAGNFIKKYWQFFLGLSVGLAMIILNRDSSKMKKTFQKFKETSDNMRDESLRIALESDEKSSDAVEEFKNNIEGASKNLIERDLELDEKEEKIKKELLENEKNNPGSLAVELQEEIDKI